LLVVLVAVGASVSAGACSESGTVPPKKSHSGGGGSAASGGSDASTTTSGSGGEPFDGGGPTGCKTDADCDGGVCHDGKCCGSEDMVCGDGCCVGAEVCLLGVCVTPGDPCVSAADCPDGNYCEPALGDEGGGGAGQGGNCTQPLEFGRCVPLPPLCDEIDGGVDAGEECFQKCEYFPPAGQLDATMKWQWGYAPAPTDFPDFPDVWATPAVARLFDANCDGKVDLADPPNLVFVSGNAKHTCCSCSGDPVSTCLTGVLRMLDGKTGQEIWSLPKAEASSKGFAGLSVALGDVDGDKSVDIVAMTGEGKIALVSAAGQVLRLSDKAVDGLQASSFGWGGGISLGDMNGDGLPEIAYCRTLFDTGGNAITRKWVGTAGYGGSGLSACISHFDDLDGDGQLELVAGRTAYRYDGTSLWSNGSGEGFTAVADLDLDGKPEVVVVTGGTLRVLEGATGTTELGPIDIPGTGTGGPPTIADFNGDGKPEIGVAMQNLYSVIMPDYVNNTIFALWSQTNHDNSSSVTGSSVFDFEGDGKAEVLYNDECYLWVYDGQDGKVLFTANTQSFTATEASIVADVDGDGHAEVVLVSNGANPNSWHCAHHTDPNGQYPLWSKPQTAPDYRGITVFGDSASSWVGTRTLWNQHAYEVTNVCDPRDGACAQGSYYGQIPSKQQTNWTFPWLNNFRQNVQDKGLFDAPDATVALAVECAKPVPLAVGVRNIGMAGLPPGVAVGVYALQGKEVLVASGTTTKLLMPGQTEVLALTADAQLASTDDTFVARILIDPDNPTFHECRDDNNESKKVKPDCVQ
jgi:hypothetical protein